MNCYEKGNLLLIFTKGIMSGVFLNENRNERFTLKKEREYDESKNYNSGL